MNFIAPLALSGLPVSKLNWVIFTVETKFL